MMRSTVERLRVNRTPVQAPVYKRDHVRSLGGVNLSRLLCNTCFCCGLAVDIVSSLIMAAVCGDNVNCRSCMMQLHNAAVLYAAFLVHYVIILGERQ